MNLGYNTQRKKLIAREYGRHIQNMIEYTTTITNTENRQKSADTIVELMGYLNPHLKTIEDFKQKLWDHIFLISDFNIDIKSPYPIPTRGDMKKKPSKISYSKKHPKFLHLGKHIESLIKKAIEEQDQEKKQYYIHVIIYSMKQAYLNWHKEGAQDEVLKAELQAISKDTLIYEFQPEIKRTLQVEKTDRDFHKKNHNKLSQNPHHTNTKNYNNSNSSNVSHALTPNNNKNKKSKYRKKY